MASGNNVSKQSYYGLNQDEFDEKYGIPKKVETTLVEKIKGLPQKVQSFCQKDKLLNLVQDRIPGIRVIKEYKLKKYILGDIVSGLSVGIFTIPQGMGYAILASVPPILGLYTCLIPAFIYFVFGNCPHSAMGTMGVSSLIIATAVEKGTSDITDMIKQSENNTELLELLEREQISIAVTVTFIGGIILLIMTIFQLGFIVSYMGDAFVSGYLTGANIRVLTHQVILCLGLKDYVNSYTGLLNYFYLVIDIFRNIKHANVATVIVSVICLAIVLTVKYVINDRYASKLKVPVPVEAIVVVIGIIVSYFTQLNAKYGVKILKHVPQGMPNFTPPSNEYIKTFALEGVICGVVSFVFSGMMAKLFCSRHGYTVNNNQELFATGLCNAVGGLFSCIGVSISPPRAFLMEMTGGHTQVAYVINALFILLVLFVIAPLLEALPVCILACLVITSCIPLFAHYIAFITYWKTSKYDFAIWLVTSMCTLAINVDTGLVVGIGFSFIIVVFQSQHPYTTCLVSHTRDGIFLDSKLTKQGSLSSKFRVYKFDSPLNFATIDMFEENLYKSAVSLSYLKKQKSVAGKHDLVAEMEINPDKSTANGKETDIIELGDFDDASRLTSTSDTLGECVKRDPLDIKVIIVDCSGIAFGDTPGARLLAKLHGLYDNYNVKFVLASCTERLKSLLFRVPDCQAVDLGRFLYPSVTDAVLAFSDKV